MPEPAPRPPDYRFLRRPIWVIGVLVAVMAVASFVALGMWQLRRLDERRQANAVVSARLNEAAVPLDQLLASTGAPASLENRPVTVTGTYAIDTEVLRVARSLNGSSGSNVLTPLIGAEGGVIVERGWVPLDTGPPPVASALPPAGVVTVVGIVQVPADRGGVLDESVTEVRFVDPAALEPRMGPLAPVYIRLVEQMPAQEGFPLTLPAPDLGNGPHLSYAIQWFLFAGVVLVGFPVLVRWTATEQRRPRFRPKDEDARNESRSPVG